MVKMVRQLVPQHIVNTKTYGRGNPCEFLLIHETANTNTGANAQAHANLQFLGNRRDASWNWQVDDKQAIQSFEDSIMCWHGGDGNGWGNRKSIGIEICVNRDGNFKKAVENAAKLTRHLMDKHDIPLSKVRQHNHASGKDCPRFLRNGSKGVTWNQFLKMIENSGTKEEKQDNTKSSGVKWVGTNDKGKRIVAIANVVNYYDTQRWSNPTGQFRKGEGWIVDNLYRVNGSLQYRVQNNRKDLYYITARKDLVKIASGSGNVVSTQPRANIAEDGYWGSDTTRALQRVFKTLEDGVISGQYENRVTLAISGIHYGTSGSRVIKALQKLIGAKQDGYIGTETVRKLQSYLGTKVDGFISTPSNMVKEMQRRLNAGTFIR